MSGQAPAAHGARRATGSLARRGPHPKHCRAADAAA